MTTEAGWEEIEEFADLELLPVTKVDAAARHYADRAWLERERTEHEALALSLEEELDALFETLRPGDPAREAEATTPDPPGWPNL